MEEHEVNLWDYLMVLVRWRRMIILNCLAVCVVVAAISLFLPKWYTASSSVLPPEQEGLGLGALSSVAGLASLGGGGMALPMMATPSDVFAAILRSRTVAEGVVRRMNLMEVYQAETIDFAIVTLQDRMSVDVSGEGIVAVSATEREPQLAADVANALVAELDRVNQDKNVTRARSAREFIEGRLEKTMADLARAEEDLRRFQEEHKAISLPEQTRVAIENAAQLRAELAGLEVQLGVLMKAMDPTHDEVRRLRATIDEYRKQLRRLEFGGGENPENDGGFTPPFSDLPALGLELARLTREVKVQEAVFELLTQQYEHAKIQEKRDTPTVQVLDVAVPPLIRSRPRRALLVVLAGFVSLIAGVFLAFSLEYLHRMREERSEDYAKVERIASALKGDLSRFNILRWRRSR